MIVLVLKIHMNVLNIQCANFISIKMPALLKTL